MECIEFERKLKNMLEGKVLSLDTQMRSHVDSCKNCWPKLVAARWKIAEISLDFQELKEFMGKEFIYGCDSSWELANEWNSKPRSSGEEITEFYKNTPWYIYNLVLWKASGQRPMYVKMAGGILEKHNIKSILDFGSGVGTDALEFVEMGFSVQTYEINTLCNRFLEWRMQKRGRKISINSDLGEINGQFDLLWTMDVIEHLQDPVAELSPILGWCRLMVYDTEFSGKSGGRHPFHFTHREQQLEDAWRNFGFVRVQSTQSETSFNTFLRM